MPKMRLNVPSLEQARAQKMPNGPHIDHAKVGFLENNDYKWPWGLALNVQKMW